MHARLESTGISMALSGKQNSNVITFGSTCQVARQVGIADGMRGINRSISSNPVSTSDERKPYAAKFCPPAHGELRRSYSDLGGGQSTKQLNHSANAVCSKAGRLSNDFASEFRGDKVDSAQHCCLRTLCKSKSGALPTNCLILDRLLDGDFGTESCHGTNCPSSYQYRYIGTQVECPNQSTCRLSGRRSTLGKGASTPFAITVQTVPKCNSVPNDWPTFACPIGREQYGGSQHSAEQYLASHYHSTPDVPPAFETQAACAISV